MKNNPQTSSPSLRFLLSDKLLTNLPKNSGLLIAYSGGADSTALLHILALVKNVRAIHINHGLQTSADDWQNHCRKTCDSLGIPLIIEQAQLKDSSENTCRIARYAFFEKHLKPQEILLTAHHAQDQAETILLKLIRGTGTKGLCGIDKIRPFAQGYLARPLLDYSPDILKQYLIDKQLNWIEDQSNQDNNYRRNFIRNKIIPSLQTIMPDAVNNIARSASNVEQSQQLLNKLINFDDKQLAIEKLLELPRDLQATLFYHWLSSKNLPVPDKKSLLQLSYDFIHANSDKHPHYKNKHYQLFRYKNAIYCIENYQHIDSKTQFEWNTQEDFILPNNCGVLSYSDEDHLNLTIRFNQTAQKLKPLNKHHTKSIKNLFQENNIPVWEKHNTPFIYHENKLVSLGYSWSDTEELFSCITYTPKELII